MQVIVDSLRETRMSLEYDNYRIDSLYSVMEMNKEELDAREYLIFQEMRRMNDEISKICVSLFYGKGIGYEILKRNIENFREYCRKHKETQRIMTKMFDVSRYPVESRNEVFKKYFKKIMQLAV